MSERRIDWDVALPGLTFFAVMAIAFVCMAVVQVAKVRECRCQHAAPATVEQPNNPPREAGKEDGR